MRAIFIVLTLLAATTAPNLSDPKTAAKAFESAVNTGDAELVKETCAGTDEQIAVAVAVTDSARAERQLSDAARAKYGDESAKLLADPNYKPLDFPLDDPATIANVDGDSATLVLPSRLKPLMTLIRSAGTWKVDVGSIPFLSRAPSGLAQVEERSAKVKTELAEEIEIGQYATAEDAARAKSEKLLRAEGKMK